MKMTAEDDIEFKDVMTSRFVIKLFLTIIFISLMVFSGFLIGKQYSYTEAQAYAQNQIDTYCPKKISIYQSAANPITIPGVIPIDELPKNESYQSGLNKITIPEVIPIDELPKN